MNVTELCNELNRISERFAGPIEVYSGGAPITGLAVLPRSAVDATSDATGVIVSILSRATDQGRSIPSPSSNPR